MSEIQETSEQIPSTLEKERDDHIIVATGLDWCELTHVLIELQQEFYELKPYMTSDEILYRRSIIYIYEIVKGRMVAGHSRGPEYLKQVVDKELFGDEVLSDEYY